MGIPRTPPLLACGVGHKLDFGLPAFWTQLQSGAAMEAPTLVEVDDLDASPAGSLETGSPSVYSDMGTSPPPLAMAAPSRHQTRSRCSCARLKEFPTSAWVLTRSAPRRPPRAGGTSSGGRAAGPRGPTPRTTRCGRFAGRAKRAASSDKPQQLDVLKVGALARQDLHINVGLPTRTPSSGLPTGFSATSSEEESVAPVPTKVKRPWTRRHRPADQIGGHRVVASALAEPPDVPEVARLRFSAVGEVAGRHEAAEARRGHEESPSKAIALGDADALKARTPTDGPSNLIRDVEEAEERYAPRSGSSR